MQEYQQDYRVWYFNDDGKLDSFQSIMEVPLYFDEENIPFLKISEAVNRVQKYGCAGINLHNPAESFKGKKKEEAKRSYPLLLAILRHAIELYGESFEVIYRGKRDDFPDEKHKILFGSRNQEVAGFYGKIVSYQNVRGLLTYSLQKSVVDDSYECDEEIIFFP